MRKIYRIWDRISCGRGTEFVETDVTLALGVVEGIRVGLDDLMVFAVWGEING